MKRTYAALMGFAIAFFAATSASAQDTYGRSAERASRLPLIEHEAQTRQPERWFALRRLLGGAA